MAAEQCDIYTASSTIKIPLTFLPSARLHYRAMTADLAHRISRRLAKVDKSARAASLEAGLSDAFIRNILKGKSQSPRVENFEALAAVLGTTATWLLRGEGPEEAEGADHTHHIATRIPVEGLVGAGGEIEPDYRDGDGENVRQIEVALSLQPGLIAFEVWGDSMLPKYDPGDLVIVHRDPTSPERVLNDVALVVTEDGRRFIKRVRRGSREGLYNLESFNARTMEDVPVVHFGMIYLVLPAKQAHTPVGEKEVHRRAGHKKKQAAE